MDAWEQNLQSILQKIHFNLENLPMGEHHYGHHPMASSRYLGMSASMDWKPPIVTSSTQFHRSPTNTIAPSFPVSQSTTTSTHPNTTATGNINTEPHPPIFNSSTASFHPFGFSGYPTKQDIHYAVDMDFVRTQFEMMKQEFQKWKKDMLFEFDSRVAFVTTMKNKAAEDINVQLEALQIKHKQEIKSWEGDLQRKVTEMEETKEAVKERVEMIKQELSELKDVQKVNVDQINNILQQVKLKFDESSRNYRQLDIKLETQNNLLSQKVNTERDRFLDENKSVRELISSIRKEMTDEQKFIQASLNDSIQSKFSHFRNELSTTDWDKYSQIEKSMDSIQKSISELKLKSDISETKLNQITEEFRNTVTQMQKISKQTNEVEMKQKFDIQQLESKVFDIKSSLENLKSKKVVDEKSPEMTKYVDSKFDTLQFAQEKLEKQFELLSLSMKEAREAVDSLHIRHISQENSIKSLTQHKTTNSSHDELRTKMEDRFVEIDSIKSQLHSNYVSKNSFEILDKKVSQLVHQLDQIALETKTQEISKMAQLKSVEANSMLGKTEEEMHQKWKEFRAEWENFKVKQSLENKHQLDTFYSQSQGKLLQTKTEWHTKLDAMQSFIKDIKSNILNWKHETEQLCDTLSNSILSSVHEKLDQILQLRNAVNSMERRLLHSSQLESPVRSPRNDNSLSKTVVIERPSTPLAAAKEIMEYVSPSTEEPEKYLTTKNTYSKGLVMPSASPMKPQKKFIQSLDESTSEDKEEDVINQGNTNSSSKYNQELIEEAEEEIEEDFVEEEVFSPLKPPLPKASLDPTKEDKSSSVSKLKEEIRNSMKLEKLSESNLYRTQTPRDQLNSNRSVKSERAESFYSDKKETPLSKQAIQYSEQELEEEETGAEETEDDGTELQQEVDEAEVSRYAQWLGLDADDEDLLWIAREGLTAPLPEKWAVRTTEDGEIFYLNKETKESSWDHPMDSYYKKLAKEEKARKLQKQVESTSSDIKVVPKAETPRMEVQKLELIETPRLELTPVETIGFDEPKLILPLNTSGFNSSNNTTPEPTSRLEPLTSKNVPKLAPIKMTKSKEDGYVTSDREDNRRGSITPKYSTGSNNSGIGGLLQATSRSIDYETEDAEHIAFSDSDRSARGPTSAISLINPLDRRSSSLLVKPNVVASKPFNSYSEEFDEPEVNIFKKDTVSNKILDFDDEDEFEDGGSFMKRNSGLPPLGKKSLPTNKLSNPLPSISKPSL